MDPLINGIDPTLLRVLDKRGQERDPVLRRKRPPVSEEVLEEKVEEASAESYEENNEENNQELDDPDTPKHTLDDLA
jgi:hypothetical protein